MNDYFLRNKRSCRVLAAAGLTCVVIDGLSCAHVSKRAASADATVGNDVIPKSLSVLFVVEADASGDGSLLILLALPNGRLSTCLLLTLWDGRDCSASLSLSLDTVGESEGYGVLGPVLVRKCGSRTLMGLWCNVVVRVPDAGAPGKSVSGRFKEYSFLRNLLLPEWSASGNRGACNTESSSTCMCS